MTPQKMIRRAFRQAIQFHQSGNLAQAEQKYREILALEPDNPTANHFLGLIALHFEKNDAAAVLMQKAVTAAPDYAEAHSNLGIALMNLGQLDLAEKHVKTALNILSDFPEAYYNLGLIAAKIDDMDGAEKQFRRSIELKPEYGEAYYELGRVLDRRGEHEAAIDCFRKTLTLNADYPAALTYLAIEAWINEDLSALAGYLEKLVPVTAASNMVKDNFIRPFYLFLTKLLEYRSGNAELYTPDAGRPDLYLVGDSHCLVSAHLPLPLNKVLYNARPRIIIGCKAWHLGNEASNSYKEKFEKIINGIAPGSSVIFMFGEIDCRLDEGIIKNLKKTGRDVEGAVREVVDGYVKYVSRILKDREITPIFYGVASPLMDEAKLDPGDEKLLTEVIAEFNRLLAAAAKEAGFAFLDIYNATNDKEGRSSGALFIDNFHVMPTLLGQLMEDI